MVYNSTHKSSYILHVETHACTNNHDFELKQHVFIRVAAAYSSGDY